MELFDRTNAPKRADTWFVYALVDSREPEEIRYIGITNDPRRRLKRHGLEDSGLYKVRWIKSVRREGGDVLMRILHSGLRREEAKTLEIAIVSQCRASGARLTNMTDGGDGVDGLWDDAFRKRMSEIHRSICSTPEAREMMGEKSRLAWSDPDTRAVLEQARKDMWTDDFRARVSASRKGKVHSDASRANMSASLRVRFSDPLEREKISLAHRVRYQSDGARAATSEAKRKSPPHADNDTGFKGVSMRRDSGKFRARIDLHSGQKNLGTFPTAEEAAMAYDKAAYAAWGGDCYLNFPDRIAA